MSLWLTLLGIIGASFLAPISSFTPRSHSHSSQPITHNLPHPIHVALSEVEYNIDSERFEASHKIFTDDLEEAIRRRYGVSLRIGTTNQHPKADSLITRYVTDHFRIAPVGGSAIYFAHVGVEHVAEGATWLYVASPQMALPPRLVVHNTILLHLYDDQRNLLHLLLPTGRRSHSFGNGDGAWVVRD